MKTIKLRLVLLIFGLTVISCNVFAQGVAINTTGNPADASAMLDVQSATGGILIPRMSFVQRGNLSGPATGLLIYQTDNLPGFYFYNGTVWTRISTGLDVSGTLNYVSKFTGTNSLGNSQIFDNGTNVGIGTSSPTYKLHVNGSFGSAIFYDTDNANFYVDPASISVYNNINTSIIFDRDNTSYYLNPATASVLADFRATGMVQFTSLAGSGNRIVMTDATGIIYANTAAGAGLVSGSGTVNYVSKWSPNGNTLANSIIYDNGTNLGVGTSSPSYRLHVSGTGYFTDGTNSSYLGGASAGNGVYATGSNAGVSGQSANYGVLGQGTNYGVYGSSANYGVYGSGGTFGTYGTGVYGVFGNGTTYGVYGQGGTYGVYGQSANWAGYFIGNTYISGNTGIGIAPTYRLHVSGTGYFVNGSNSAFLAEPGNGRGVSGVGVNYGVYGQSSLYGVFGQGGSYGVYGMGSIGVYGQGTTWASYFDGNTYISGNTGLGTTSPTAQLHTTGSVRFASYTNGFLRVDANGYLGVYPSSSLFTAGTGLSWSGSTLNSVWTASGNNIYNNNTGFVGIGTASPSYNLHVNGSAAAGIFYDINNSAFYLDPASTSITNDMRANIFYDYGNTNYYVDPASTSLLYNLRIGTDITTTSNQGVFWTGSTTDYGIFREAGAWASPFPDLRIAFHTGIKIGANSLYNGTRFYNNSDMATQIFSVGDGDNHVRVYYNLYSPILYDLNNTGYYIDPASTSITNDMRANIFYDNGNTSFYLQPRSVSILNDVRATIFYDRDNTTFYLDPASISNMATLYTTGTMRFGSLAGTGSRIVMADATGVLSASTAAGAGLVSGSGAATAVAFWNGTNTLSYNSSLFWDNTNSRLGIGNTSPSFNLHVNGTAAASIFYDQNNSSFYLDPASTSITNDMRANIFYDYGNTNYFADPSSTSILYNLRIGTDVTTSSDQGVFWFPGTDYGIFREAGAWTSPYPDLRIAFSTGIKIGASYLYNGVRFYNNSDMATQIFSVGDGDNYVRSYYGIFSPILYDINNASYYIDPASTSITNDMRANIFYDSGNTSFYLQPRSVSYLNDVRASIFYDRDNTGYYLDPASTSNLANLYTTGTNRFSALAGTGSRIVLADATGILSATSAAGAGLVSGSGTTNYVTKWTSASTQGNSQIFDNGTNVGIGTATPGQKLVVNGGNIDVIASGGGLRLGANNWSDGGSTYGHILTDNGSYDALMIVGNNTAGDGHRNVRIWDHLNVEGTLTRGGNTVWDAANDGSGSGLDADLLDGNHASAFAVSSHTHPWNQVTSKPAAWLDAANLIQDNANFNNSVPSGFYQYNNATNAPTAGTWYNMINVRHSNSGNDHGFQIAASYYDENIWTRTYQGGTGNNDGSYTPWRALIHTGNLSSNAILNQYTSAQSASMWISGETRTGGWFRSNSGGTGWYSEPYGSGIYATTSGEVATYNGSYFRITGGANGSGNLRFDAANPYIVSSSYFLAPGGAYFNGGTVYTEAQYQCRGGIHNDNAGDLTIAGGTSGTTYFAGSISGMSGYFPSNYLIRLTPNLHLNSTAGYAVILNWDNGTTGNTSTLRIGNGAGSDVFQVWAGQGNTGINTSPSANYKLTAYDYDYTAGTSYYQGSSRAVIEGHDVNSQSYEFGVGGWAYNDYPRSGGVIGCQWSASYWGSLGYKNSGGTGYGCYYTSVGSGGGYMNNNGVFSGIGSGGYGGVMGGWSRGEVLGFATAGELYASYNLGNEYTSGVSADIVTTATERIPVYSVTSNDVKVYADGSAQLVNGKCYVLFDESFANVISKDGKPTITVTPNGECNGLYTIEISSRGFTVKELNNGTSSIEFSWIAIGKRIDAEKAGELPDALKDKNFDNNLKGVMFNENDKDNSATPIWWDGTTLRFDKMPETTVSKPKEDPNQPRNDSGDDVNRLIQQNNQPQPENRDWRPTPEQPVKNAEEIKENGNK